MRNLSRIVALLLVLVATQGCTSSASLSASTIPAADYNTIGEERVSASSLAAASAADASS